MVNVAYGVSHAQKGGTSLINFANAEAIAKMVNHFISKGVSIKEMGILTYYIGQKYVILRKLRETGQGQAWEATDPIDISTVDSYQGQERPIIFLDIVVAHVMPDRPSQVDDDESDDDDDPRLKKANDFGKARASNYVREAHRLCCAVTRAKDCHVTFLQAALILGSAKENQRKSRAAISDFARDA